MKKKIVKLQKLSLNKSAIASLNGQQQEQAVGGATEGNTSCHCSMRCVPSVQICPETVGLGCVPTAATVCFIC